jgi:hypothetical protein
MESVPVISAEYEEDTTEVDAEENDGQATQQGTLF